MNSTRLARNLLGVLLVAAIALGGGALRAVEAANEHMQWWREAKFGMFIHWGVYAVPAGIYEGKPVDGIGEWIMQRAQVPVEQYREFASQFNPQEYDPEAWAELADQAGMKYMVITSKHHDGFALYDSAVTDWDIAGASPYGKDLLAPLASAARKRGLKFGLYYSQAQDWNHPGGAKAGFEDLQGWDDAHKGSFDRYLTEIAVPQTREILERYQPDVLWWDTPMLMTPERARPLHALLKSHPEIVTNDRLGGGFPGDVKTPEQYIPQTGLAGDWETCMTLNDTWGFKLKDQNWKSTETLVRNLVDIVSKGGNYLLNVGPDADGKIPQASIDRLREIGEWMSVNGGAIYGSTASPCRAPEWGRVACQDGRLLLFVFNWPEDGRLLVPVRATAKRCYLINKAESTFPVSSSDEGIAIELRGTAPDKICSVVVLELSGPVEGIVPRVVQQNDGSLTLTARDGVLQGEHVRVEQIGGETNLGYWENANDSVQWPCTLSSPQEFLVSAEMAAPAPSRFTFQCGSASLPVEAVATGSFNEFKKVDLGRISVEEVGEVTAAVRPDKNGWSAINLRRVILQPVD